MYNGKKENIVIQHKKKSLKVLENMIHSGNKVEKKIEAI